MFLWCSFCFKMAEHSIGHFLLSIISWYGALSVLYNVHLCLNTIPYHIRSYFVFAYFFGWIWKSVTMKWFSQNKAECPILQIRLKALFCTNLPYVPKIMFWKSIFMWHSIVLFFLFYIHCTNLLKLWKHAINLANIYQKRFLSVIYWFILKK